uniref:RNA-directed RNA polymerase n=1 Tax=Leviviridae sp. TaxID=2027243 RepID=A0A514D4C8_9VIRU|nr:MAG: RNA-dependent RNA polymerase [Leviviridae sp.]
MKSLMYLWSRLAEESADHCCTSARLDINTVQVRIEHEGLSFFTITLPSLGKSLQRWLDQGEVGINTAFARGSGGRLPRLLGGFFARVFDRSSGLLLDEPCIESIRALRQLTLMFGKMELPCSRARELDAVRNYVKCEQEVRLFDSELSRSELSEFTRMSNMLFGSVFSQMDRDVYYGRLVPKHGPGSTADGLTGNRKFGQRFWTDRLEAVLPAGENLLPNWRYNQQLDEVTFLEPGAEVPVKVTLVPKTLKTPRVIAMEPTCMQYMQQALLRSFLEHFDEDDFLTRVIGFDDQTPNQELARQGSLDQRTATLDLSDASDRVSNQLVRAMVSRWPHLHTAVDATRSRKAEIPGTGEVIRLAKYASMGSALCFPIEAMVFTTLIFLGIQRSLNKPLYPRDLRRFADSVRVYGDDLIVPVDHVCPVVRTLEHFGAKVGTDKSFWTGKFRESCGREFFNGHDVSIIRVRQEFPTRRNDVSEVESLVSLRNQLYSSGYWRTCQWLDGVLTEVLVHFPVVGPKSSLLGRVSFLSEGQFARRVRDESVATASLRLAHNRSHTYRVDTQREKVHPGLHIPLVRGYVVQAKPPRDHLEGTDALLKCLLELDAGTWLRGQAPWYPSDTVEENPLSWREPLLGSSEHLERCGRPKSSSMKLGWRSPL